MKLGSILAVTAAVLAIAGLSPAPPALAGDPTGGSPHYLAVDGATSPNGAAPISGTYAGGDYSFAGGTYGCVGGSIAGSVRRGAWAAASDEIVLSTFNVTCTSIYPPGINATWSLTPGCSVKVNFDNATNVHDGLVDTGTGSKFQRVPGSVFIDPNCPLRVSVLGNLCTAQVSGTAAAYVDETVRTGNVQTLGLTGSGVGFTNGSGLCASILNGPFNLNDVRFDVSTNLDFRRTQVPTIPSGPPAYLAVDGATGPDGDAELDGTFSGGTASFGGGTYGCVGGTVSGTIRRGSWSTSDEMVFPTLDITCATPFGINAVVSMTSGCSAKVNFDNATNVHTGLVDTGTGSKFQRVPGTVSIDPNCPARVSVLGNLCTAQVSGTAAAYFDETVKTGNVQTLGLTGTGLTLSNGSGLCASILNGPFNLNNVRFETSPQVDFRLTALP